MIACGHKFNQILKIENDKNVGDTSVLMICDNLDI